MTPGDCQYTIQALIPIKDADFDRRAVNAFTLACRSSEPRLIMAAALDIRGLPGIAQSLPAWSKRCVLMAYRMAQS